MRKIKLAIVLLLIVVLLIACTKSRNYTNSSQTDSLYTEDKEEKVGIDISTETSKDSSIAYNDPIFNGLSSVIDTSQVVKEDNWEYGIEDTEYPGQSMSGIPSSTMSSLGGRSVQANSFSSSSADIGSMDIEVSKMASKPKLSSNAVESEDALGFSVGGAKDVNNFRENIKNNYMPEEEDITHEGIFYDYFFDNNITKKATHLFEPAYTSYKNKHPLTNKEEIYLSVGLNSNLTASSFARKKLNLTIVLDISGSMSSSFDRYYYDGGVRREYNEDFDDRSKMEIAKECIIDLTKHLKTGDRFAVVLFDNQSFLAKPFSLVEKTDMEAIRKHISDISPRGGTNMYAGINTATELYSKLPEYNPKAYDNRVIFLTDAMPNTDVTDKNSLWGVMKANAENKIYTTFVGVGVDLNSELIKYITRTPGANYYSVHNANDFKKRMDTQFDYMVTPLVFDLTLHLKSDNYQIEAVYGSPEADQTTGEIMRVNTLFPSETEGGQTRGGIILIKLKKTGNKSDIELTCSYKDRNGIPELVREKIEFTKAKKGTDNGIRKAVLLSRYVNLMHDWINNKSNIESQETVDDWQYGNGNSKHTKIIRPRSRWERNSQKLAVNSYYKDLFMRFKQHFAQEATAIQDEDLRKELDILEKLADEVKINTNLSIMPENFWGNWDDANSGVWTFGITKNKFRTGNEFYSYEECSYNKTNGTYMIKIAKGNKDRTYYFRFENARSMYYSSDNQSFKRVVKRN